MKASDLSHQIEKCKQLIEKKLNWGSSEYWTHSFYEKLSDTIENEVHERISFSTLKRIWGKLKPDSGISIFTLNILARYIGYTNWEDFTISCDNLVVSHEKTLELKVERVNFKGILSNKLFLYLIGFIAIVLLVFAWYKISYKDYDSQYFLFVAKSYGKYAPSTAVINYDIKALKNKENCFMIMGEGDIKILNPDSHQITKVFKKPNYYFLKLYENNILKKTLNYRVYTTGWQKSVLYSDNHIVVDSIINGELSLIKPENIQTLKNVPDYYWTEYYNLNDNFAKVDGDNMEFEIKFRNNKQDGGLENQFVAVLQSDSSLIRIQLANQKGIGIMNKISEVVIEKNAPELSMFVKDFSQFHTLKIRNLNQNLTLYFDDTQIYTTQYKTKLYRLVSLQFSFSGCGVIDYYKFLDLKGNVLLQEKFVR